MLIPYFITLCIFYYIKSIEPYMTISVNTNITHRYLVISFGCCKLVNAPLFWPKAPSLASQRDWIQCLCLCTLMPLFSAQQKMSFLSRPGPPKVISFKNRAVFKHRWPLKIKGQHVNSPQPRSQIFPLPEMKGIFKKTSCAWSCLHFCPMGLFGQGCQSLSDHKTKMCCPAACWGCQGFAPAPVHRRALYIMRGTPRDVQVPGWFVIPTWLGHCCPRGSSRWRGKEWGTPWEALQGATTQGCPVASCCRSHLKRVLVWRGGGHGLRVAVPTLSSLGCPREVAPRERCWRCCRARVGSKAPRLVPVPAPPKPRAERRAAAKLSRQRGIKTCCIYNADLSVCSRKRNEYSKLAGKGDGPATRAHTHVFAQTSIYEWTHPGEAGGEATLISHYGCKLKNLQVSSWNTSCKA